MQAKSSSSWLQLLIIIKLFALSLSTVCRENHFCSSFICTLQRSPARVSQQDQSSWISITLHLNQLISTYVWICIAAWFSLVFIFLSFFMLRKALSSRQPIIVHAVVLREACLPEKRMNFRKISEREAGVISDLKNFIAIFFALETAFLSWISRKTSKRGGSFPIWKIALQI